MSKQGAHSIRIVDGLSRSVRGLFPPLTRTVALVSALAAGSARASAQQAPPGNTPPPQAGTVEAPIVLPAVPVEGKADSHRTEESRLPRVATALVDTPQTVAVVPEQVMDEQRATTVREALRNVSGITMSAGEGGRQGDTFILRGFSGQNDVFRDGGRDLGWFTRDTFNLEGVEVFFGPSSVLFGRGSTGGAINLVTKTPKRGNFAEALPEVARRPVLTAQVTPVYPPEARRLRTEGTVVLRIVVGRDGAVEAGSIRVVRSVAGLDAAATDAVARWRFSPAIGHSGQPVRVVIEVPFQFFLR